jgi:hypothetical protein
MQASAERQRPHDEPAAARREYAQVSISVWLAPLLLVCPCSFNLPFLSLPFSAERFDLSVLSHSCFAIGYMLGCRQHALQHALNTHTTPSPIPDTAHVGKQTRLGLTREGERQWSARTSPGSKGAGGSANASPSSGRSPANARSAYRSDRRPLAVEVPRNKAPASTESSPGPKYRGVSAGIRARGCTCACVGVRVHACLVLVRAYESGARIFMRVCVHTRTRVLWSCRQSKPG